MNAVTQVKHWPAHLYLDYARVENKTIVARRQHAGPLTIQKPFYPENVCHTYLLHPPGGVASGDSLDIRINLQEQAHSLLTTPASGKFYRSSGSEAQLEQRFDLAPGTAVEWLPQENIFFDGAQVKLLTRFNIQAGARFFAWDISCFGRPSCGERWLHGRVDQRFEIWQENRPLFLERNLLDGNSEIMHAHWGMGGNPVSAIMLVNGMDKEKLEDLRDLNQTMNGKISLTLINQLLVARYLGEKVNEAKSCFHLIWQHTRPQQLGIEACIPRIWNT